MCTALLNSGCGDGRPDNLTVAAEAINSSKSGLVQVAERSGFRVAAKYLTPEYLALAEIQRGGDERSVDSLASLYRSSLSFYVTVTSSSDNGNIILPQEGGLVTTQGGVMDVGASNSLFLLKVEEKTWPPVSALPETHPGVEGKSWFVTFAIDPHQEFRGRETISLIYVDPDRHDTTQFTYKVADLLRSKSIASNN